MLQNKMHIRFRRVLLCAIIIIAVSLVLCMVIAAMIRGNVIPVTLESVLPLIALGAATTAACAICIGRGGESPVAEMIASGVITILLLLVLKMIFYSEAEFGFIKPVAAIAIGEAASQFFSHPRRSKRRMIRKAHRAA